MLASNIKPKSTADILLYIYMRNKYAPVSKKPFMNNQDYLTPPFPSAAGGSIISFSSFCWFRAREIDVLLSQLSSAGCSATAGGCLQILT